MKRFDLWAPHFLGIFAIAVAVSQSVHGQDVPRDTESPPNSGDSLWQHNETSTSETTNWLYLSAKGPAQHVGQREINVINDTLWSAIYDRLWDMCGRDGTLNPNCGAPNHRTIGKIKYNSMSQVKDAAVTVSIIDGNFPDDLATRKLLFDLIAYTYQAEANDNCYTDQYADNGRNFCQVGRSVVVSYITGEINARMEVGVDFSRQTPGGKYDACRRTTATNIQRYFDNSLKSAFASKGLQFNNITMFCSSA